MAVNSAAPLSTGLCCSISAAARQSLSGRLKADVSLACIRTHGTFSPAQLLKMGPVSGRGRPEDLLIPRAQILATLGNTEESDVNKKTEDYSANMQQAAGTGLTYRHELGMNYVYVLPDLIVGSCLQTPADVDHLKEAGVSTILCLQQDSDLEYFSVDIGAIQNRAAEVQGIQHIRAQIRDFDPYDLRLRLPKVVATLYKATKQNEGTAYVHCTAGLGRAPAVVLTYMYWIRGYDLLEANALLQSVRHCHPKLESIKAATADLLIGNPTKKVIFSWKKGAERSVEIAGLDFGWYECLSQRIALQQGNDGHWYMDRDVPVGKYEFKYIVDGNWKTNPDVPVTEPNKDGHVNNCIEVPGDAIDAEIWEFRRQILAADFVLTEEHRKIIIKKLESMAEF